MSKYVINYIVHREGLPDVVVSPNVYYADFKKRIQSMIGFVEQMCYTYEAGKDKADWSQYSQEQFQSFRRKMLDIADEVAAIDQNIVIEEVADDSERMAEIEGYISSLWGNRKKVK